MSNSLNNLTPKVNDLDVGKLKTVSVDFQKLSDVVYNEVVWKTKSNTVNKKTNNFEEKFLLQLFWFI